jgi:hypothetical protein
MITKRKIRNVEKYLVHNLESFRIVSPELTSEIKTKLQLDKYTNNSKFLPLAVGPVSKFNAKGSWIILKDLPKETRYIMTTHWECTDWHGNHHEGDSDVYKDCYQRKRLPPPSEELILRNNKVYSDVLNITDKDRIKYNINLMLELFGECDFVKPDFTETIKIIRKNFELLPAGEYPFEKIRPLIEGNSQDNRAIRFLKDRFKFFQEAKPTTLVIGYGGYRGYVGFQYNKYLILDNTTYGNAIYVFPANTDLLLSYTKKEILDGNLHVDRIQHTKDWCVRVKKYLK